MPLALPPGRSEVAASFLAASDNDGVELGVRHGRIDQAPVDGALALDAFLDGAEGVGAVAADFAFVGDAGQAAGARQNGEQRDFRQRDRRVAVVGQEDLVARQREFIAAASGRALHGADELLAGELGRVLHAVARFVGELAEIDLVAVRRAREHADVGAGAEHLVLAGLEHDDFHFRMLEAQSLQRIGQLDVDAEVVGVELQLIALEQCRVLVDVHDQVSGFAVELELPMPVRLRRAVKIDDA